MSEKDDGGPAFSVETTATPYAPGMTLRDWFAGQALAVALANSNHVLGTVTFFMVAVDAYVFADSMLETRK